MPLQYFYWIILLVWILFGGAVQTGYVTGERAVWGQSIFLVVLFVILGIAEFGGPIK